MRHLRLLLVILLLALIASAAPASVRVASWNTKHLGWDNNKDISALVTVLSRFDVVALQEVMDASAVDDLVARLSATSGEDWGRVTSRPVGRNSYLEHYALLWRKSAADFEGGATVYLDPDDAFAREPLSAVFSDREDGQRFVLATVHIVYGDGRSDRTPEIRALADYWSWLESSFDAPAVLVGDFNMEPTDAAWQALGTDAQPLIRRGATTLSARDKRYAHLYDNIWVRPGQLDVTSSGIARYPDWLGLTHRIARKRVSDHAPVYMTMGDIAVDDSALGGDPAAGARINAPSCIDLNSAPVDRLATITHVGPVRAQAIIDRRPWHSIGELTRIRGLGKARVGDIEREGLVCP